MTNTIRLTAGLTVLLMALAGCSQSDGNAYAACLENWKCTKEKGDAIPLLEVRRDWFNTRYQCGCLTQEAGGETE